MKKYTKLFAALFCLSLLLGFAACDKKDLGLYASLDRTIEECVAVEATVTASNSDAVGFDSYQAKINFDKGLPTAGNLKVTSQASPQSEIEAWLVDSTYYLSEPYENDPRKGYFTVPEMSLDLLKHCVYQDTYLVSPYNLIVFDSLANLLNYKAWIMDEKVSDTEFTAWLNYGIKANITLENGRVKTMTVQSMLYSYNFAFKYDSGFEITAPNTTDYTKYNTASILLNGKIDYFDVYNSGDELYLSFYADHPNILCQKLELFKDANFTQAYVDEVAITSDVTIYAKVTEYTGINKTIADAYNKTVEQSSFNLLHKTMYEGFSYSVTFISKFIVENDKLTASYQSYHSVETDPASETTEEFWIEGIKGYISSDEKYTCTIPEGNNVGYSSVLGEIRYYLQEALREGEFTLTDAKYTLDSWEIVIADGLITSIIYEDFEVEFGFGQAASGFIPQRTGEFETRYVVMVYYYVGGEYDGGMRMLPAKNLADLIEEFQEGSSYIYTFTLDKAGTQIITETTAFSDFMMVYRHRDAD